MGHFLDAGRLIYNGRVDEVLEVPGV